MSASPVRSAISSKLFIGCVNTHFLGPDVPLRLASELTQQPLTSPLFCESAESGADLDRQRRLSVLSECAIETAWPCGLEFGKHTGVQVCLRELF